jgi:hypothetical protein
MMDGPCQQGKDRELAARPVDLMSGPGTLGNCMNRDKSARTRIQQYLRTHGPVDDPTGYATSVLKDATEYQGTAVAFIQLIAAMDRDGEIAREVRGKRTYRISLGQAHQALPVVLRPDSAADGAQAAQPIEIDYDRLARAVVREFFAQTSQNATADSGQAMGRLRAERDEYALLLEMARLRLGALLGDRTEDQAGLLRRLSTLSE